MFRPDNVSYNIILTNRCFLNCGHCFLNRASQDTLDITTVRKITRRLVSPGQKVTLNWGGGEPLTLGKDYLRQLVEMDCFDSMDILNTIYSTFLIPLDEEWRFILSRFDSTMYSVDSYRECKLGDRLNLALKNLSAIDVEKNISYTPYPEDNNAVIDKFYLRARDIGAKTFHIGFLYNAVPIPTSFYYRAIDRLVNLEARYLSPRIGFYHRLDQFGQNPKAASGWRAFDCFTKGLYISPDRIVTSCYILKDRGYPVPAVPLQDFLHDPSINIQTLNSPFIRSFYMEGLSEECYRCDYFSVCMGGCPYFTHISGNGKDFYCEVYRKILDFMSST